MRSGTKVTSQLPCVLLAAFPSPVSFSIPRDAQEAEGAHGYCSPLTIARTSCDSHWKCHQSPVSPSAATEMLEVSTQGGMWPPA